MNFFYWIRDMFRARRNQKFVEKSEEKMGRFKFDYEKTEQDLRNELSETFFVRGSLIQEDALSGRIISRILVGNTKIRLNCLEVLSAFGKKYSIPLLGEIKKHNGVYTIRDKETIYRLAEKGIEIPEKYSGFVRNRDKIS
jgi:hypothetical protein